MEKINKKQQIIAWLEKLETDEEVIEKFYKAYHEYRLDERPLKEKGFKVVGFYLPKEIDESLNQIAAGKKKGFKNFLALYAISDFINRYGEEIDKHN
ncbi:hypothetical protein DRW41_16035 [Neobacillus piezotolerans]|uniref:Uncharacterized protein n=1 Tax=Neobacillus piezotolerans TaxID=2259171 RepID=A0A3D8GNK5_9BACI|nr:hypothetical protein [Neobacillus piezotolerans]RDU35656.1 hypothetical protein DRW41_16035 [Neobacillus piezotolerans]